MQVSYIRRSLSSSEDPIRSGGFTNVSMIQIVRTWRAGNESSVVFSYQYKSNAYKSPSDWVYIIISHAYGSETGKWKQRIPGVVGPILQEPVGFPALVGTKSWASWSDGIGCNIELSPYDKQDF